MGVGIRVYLEFVLVKKGIWSYLQNLPMVIEEQEMSFLLTQPYSLTSLWLTLNKSLIRLKSRLKRNAYVRNNAKLRERPNSNGNRKSGGKRRKRKKRGGCERNRRNLDVS